MSVFESANGILRRAYDRFFMNVKARVHEARESGLTLKFFEDAVITGVISLTHQLRSGGAIHMDYSGTGAFHEVGTIECNSHIPRGVTTAIQSDKILIRIFSQCRRRERHEFRALQAFVEP